MPQRQDILIEGYNIDCPYYNSTGFCKAPLCMELWLIIHLVGCRKSELKDLEGSRQIDYNYKGHLIGSYMGQRSGLAMLITFLVIGGLWNLQKVTELILIFLIKGRKEVKMALINVSTKLKLLSTWQNACPIKRP